MRVACYLRVSTDEQKVDLQKDAIDRYVKFKDWCTPAPVFFVDQGESGAKTSRPAFDRMMKRLRQNDFDALLVWKFDRIGRSTAHLISILDELKTLKVDFISVVENVDTTTAMGKMMFTIIAALAEFERDTLIMRTKAGMDAAKERGIHCGRPDNISPEIKERIKQLKADGATLSDLCTFFPKVSRASIYRIMRGIQ